MINYVIWILVAALYAPVFASLYSMRWDSVDYTHAYFILPISLWLTWRKRREIKKIFQEAVPGKKNLFSFCILFLGLLMFIFGWRQNYIFIQALSLIPFLFGLTGYLYGINMVKTLSFPILYLLLLVPPPFGILDSITLPMRHGISVATEAILKLLGYPISREGLLLTIGYNDIFMGQPCSGFRSLITMFSLVLVYVYISKGNMTKKLILTSFIVPMALVGNLVRVITLCLITFYFGEEVGQGFFHNFSGIVIFIITLLGLMGVEAILDRKLKSTV
ncbi:MAG TPA: exosortase [Nitrospirae bacterium]|nr:transmembrane exosortase [bacterium BMS3Abin06]HDH13273.1 exosortase [Nitrospirota bacterium]HDZ01759.1 exosortase [Nitrospirota bacterium]